MNVDGMIAVITGASSGLGAALSYALVTKGAVVYGVARNKERLIDIENKLGKNFIPVSMDINNEKEIASWVSTTFSNSHCPCILINNAGAGYFAKIDELSIERWHEMIHTNLNGLFYITSKIVPLMKVNQNTCHIINIGSILGKTTRSEAAAYSTTKYGVQGFSEALFKELRSDKIKVTCVNPGSIDTHFFKDSGIQPHSNMLQPKDIAAFIICILETPDNFLVDEITIRPLLPNSQN
ncbi:MAG: SDR family NAD(P)-dependent oxidoreductase [Ginsengibacter sp.]